MKRLRNRLVVEGRLAAVYACPPMEVRIRAQELLSQSPKLSVRPGLGSKE